MTEDKDRTDRKFMKAAVKQAEKAEAMWEI